MNKKQNLSEWARWGLAGVSGSDATVEFGAEIDIGPQLLCKRLKVITHCLVGVSDVSIRVRRRVLGGWG